MKILMLIPATPHSTLAHRPLSLGRELSRLGHEVTMLSPSFDKHSNWRDDRPASMGPVKVVYPRQWRTRCAPLNLIPYLFSACWQILRREADMLYLYKPNPITNVAFVATWLKGTPVVLDMDDLSSQVMRLEGQPAFLCWLVEVCERWAARQSKGILAASRLLEQKYRTKFPRKPIVRLSNGVDLAEFAPAPVRKNSAPRIIYFGTMNRTSIIGPIIEAMPEVIKRTGSEVTLELLGDGAVRDELEALTRRLNLSENVKFRGWTTFDELPQYVSAGDIALCVTPNDQTIAAASNQKVFQYLALGLCAVVSRVGDLPLYVGDGEAGVVVPADDRMAMAKALADLLRDDKRRKTLSSKGRPFVDAYFTWEKLAVEFNQMLEAL